MSGLEAPAMAQFRKRLADAGYIEDAAGQMRNRIQTIQLGYSMGEVTVVVRQGIDYANARIERVPTHSLDRLVLIAEAIAQDLPWPVWT